MVIIKIAVVSGGGPRVKQTRNAGGSVARIDANDERCPADDQGAGDFLPQCGTGALQFQS